MATRDSIMDPNPHPSHGIPTRVVVPAQVAFNLVKMQKVTASVLERLGCPACHSGFDVRFDIERRFVVDPKLNVRGESELLR
jgi:hypothetical protein